MTEKSETEEDNQYDEEDLLFLAKIYSKCQSYEDMTICIKNIIEINQKLNAEQRNYFSYAYKNFLTEKRNRLNVISSLLKKQDNNTNKDNDNKHVLLKELKSSLQAEIYQLVNEVILIIDQYLLPNGNTTEDIIFYNKMKADYYRYLIEMEIKGENDENFLELAENCYKEAYNKAEKELPTFDYIRLNTSLNYSIFLAEVKGNKEQAINIATNTISLIDKSYNEIQIEDNKVSLLVLQMIQENLVLWTNGNLEIEEAEQ